MSLLRQPLYSKDGNIRAAVLERAAMHLGDKGKDIVYCYMQ